MLTCLSTDKPHPEIITTNNQSSLSTAVWIDLLFPTKEEAALYECLP